MLANHDRDKLVNAILFFSKRTKFCGMTKLFKLLYFLDFEHFAVTGRSVTGLTYYAWKMGPVPRDLKNEIPNAVGADLAEKVAFEEVATKKGKPLLKAKPVGVFNADLFSRREIEIMEHLASSYVNTLSDDIIEATHLENKPWDRVYNQERRKQARIPYEYAIRKDEQDFVLHLKKENDEIVLNYGD